jgi:hypothetical protein
MDNVGTNDHSRQPEDYVGLADLVAAYEAIRSLSTQALPGTLAISLVRFENVLKPWYARYNNARAEVAARVGTSVGNGNFHVEAGRVREFEALLAEAIKADRVLVEKASKLSVAAFAETKIAPAALRALAPLLLDL